MAVILKAYLRCLDRRPLLTQAVSTGILMATGDGISQIFIEQRPIREYNTSRGLRFLLFGTFLAGPTLRGWYVFLDRSIKGSAKLKSIKMLALDQSIMAPGFLVTFLGVMDYWKYKSVEHAKDNISQNFIPVLIANYKLWPAAQLINFYFVPLQHRVIYVQFVAIIWNTYLAYRTESEPQKSEET